MTLIVAAACRGGVVVAADSQITAGDVRFASEKLRRMGERVCLGFVRVPGNHATHRARAGEALRGRAPMACPLRTCDSGFWRSSIQFRGRRQPDGQDCPGRTHQQVHCFLLVIRLDGRGFCRSPRTGSLSYTTLVMRRPTPTLRQSVRGERSPTWHRRGLAHYDLPNTEMDLTRALIYRAMLDIIRTSAHGVGFPISMGLVTRAWRTACWTNRNAVWLTGTRTISASLRPKSSGASLATARRGRFRVNPARLSRTDPACSRVGQTLL